MAEVVVVGTGLFAEVVKFYLDHDSEHRVVAFAVERAFLDQPEFAGLPVVAFEDVQEHYPPATHAMFVAIGYKDVNQVRRRLFGAARKKGYELITYVHSRVQVWPGTRLGVNCFVFEDNTIQPFTVIGDDVILWSGNHIGHHAHIGDHCFITSHVVVSGNVAVGECSFLGVNATLRDSIRIGRSCVVGAGAVIMQTTDDESVHLGPRSQIIDRKSSEIGL